MLYPIKIEPIMFTHSSINIKKHGESIHTSNTVKINTIYLDTILDNKHCDGLFEDDFISLLAMDLEG